MKKSWVTARLTAGFGLASYDPLRLGGWVSGDLRPTLAWPPKNQERKKKKKKKKKKQGAACVKESTVLFLFS
jgi:hypothetical protein